MSNHVKTSNRIEYRISDDEETLEIKVPDVDKWQRCANAPSGLTIEDLKLSSSGNSVLCLTSDGYWRERSSSDSLVLTADERNRQRKEEKSKRTESNDKKKSHGFGLFSKSSRDSNSGNHASSETSSSNFGSSFEDDEEEEKEISEDLLGENFADLSHEKQSEKILTLYKSEQISEEQAIYKLEWVINKWTSAVDDFINEFSESMETASPSDWAKKFVDIFKVSIAEELRKRYIFPELLEEIELDGYRDESIKLNSFFDIATRSRNKKVENYQNERNELRNEINTNKRILRNHLILLLETVEQLIVRENKFAEIESTKVTSDGLISAYKEKKEIKEKKKDAKEDILWNKEKILSINKDIKEIFKNLNSNIAEYNKVNKELYRLTYSDIYVGTYSFYSDALVIAKDISRNEKLTDSKDLSKILQAYMLEAFVVSISKLHNDKSSNQSHVESKPIVDSSKTNELIQEGPDNAKDLKTIVHQPNSAIENPVIKDPQDDEESLQNKSQPNNNIETLVIKDQQNGEKKSLQNEPHQNGVIESLTNIIKENKRDSRVYQKKTINNKKRLTALSVGVFVIIGIFILCTLSNNSKTPSTSDDQQEKATDTIISETTIPSEDVEELSNEDIPDESIDDAENLDATSEGLYPFTSERLISEDDILNLSSKDLKIMRNEIYARHGYIFKTADMKAYFSKQSWYCPTSENVELSDIEMQNIKFIKAHE